MPRIFHSVGLIGVLFCVCLAVFQLGPDNAGSRARMNQRIREIAAALKAGDRNKANQMAEKIADQEELYYIMLAFKPRSKKGIGYGKGGGPADGVELKLRSMAREEALPSAVLLKESSDLLAMVNYIKAVNLITHQLPPKQKNNLWLQYCKDTDEGCAAFEEALLFQNPLALKTATVKINAACNTCHSVFR